MFVAHVETETEFPLAVSVDGQSFYVLRDGDGYFLASRICPHQGGIIRHFKEDACFRCPLHNWEFDVASGQGANTTSAMSMVPLTYEDGQLTVDPRLLSRLPRRATRGRSDTLSSRGDAPDIDIRLVSHAGLEINAGERSILVDPWLDGPAMLGAWRQYPNANISAAELSPDAIIITHEHSDHFHIPTLQHFDRDVPVFVPAFENRRIEYFLDQLGFTDCRTVPFEKPMDVLDGVTLKYFRPVSLFNDAISFLNIDGFKFLNLNDAGLNAGIADEVGAVDLLACIFSTGASGYPMTWSHVSEAEKYVIMERACAGRLDMLLEAFQLYNANSILPFASHFKLWQPEHRAYLEAMKTNSIDDVVAHFKAHGAGDKVVDLLPGETWNARNGMFQRIWTDRARLFEPQAMLDAVSQDYAENGKTLGLDDYWCTPDVELNPDDVRRYFESLRYSPDVTYCEDIFVAFRCLDDCSDAVLFGVNFEVVGGAMQIVDARGNADLPEFHMDVPASIVKTVIAGNLSWDEARVGCWIKWWRSTNSVHSGFLRMLQGPYNQRLPELARIKSRAWSSDVSIASLIEVHGVRAEKVLEKHGLYCVGCSLSPWESLEAGALKHGVVGQQMESLIAEMRSLA